MGGLVAVRIAQGAINMDKIKQQIEEHKLKAVHYLAKAMRAEDSESRDLWLQLHRSRWKKIGALLETVPEDQREKLLTPA